MTPTEAKKWIIPAVAVAGITAAISDITDKNSVPRIRIAIGAVIVATVLTFLAETLPDVAGGLAGVILVGALLLKGGVFSKVANILA